MKNVISTDKAPAAIGPYSQAIEVNGMVYTSGIIPVVPATGEIPEGSVAQAEQALTNLSHLLETAGTSMANVVKTTVFIKEMNDFAAINEVYATFFEGAYPARSCVEVARLPKDVIRETEAIATKYFRPQEPKNLRRPKEICNIKSRGTLLHRVPRLFFSESICYMIPIRTYRYCRRAPGSPNVPSSESWRRPSAGSGPMTD